MQSSAPLSTFQMIATSNSSRSYFLLVSTAYAVVGKTELYIPKKRLKECLYILYFGSKEEKNIAAVAFQIIRKSTLSTVSSLLVYSIT